MDPAFTRIAAHLAADLVAPLTCACGVRNSTRNKLAALVRPDARLHLVGPQRELWCRVRGEVPLRGRAKAEVPARRPGPTRRGPAKGSADPDRNKVGADREVR